MIDIADIREAFPKLSDIKPLGVASGQKDVLTASDNGKRVCLKIVKIYKDGEARTEREIQAVTRLASDYVPSVFDNGQIILGGEKRQYIIEQFIEGQTYQEILSINSPQPLQAVLQLIESLLLACVDFEDQNLVHRDIKPANLMIDNNRKVWVIDFGLVRHLDLVSLTLNGAHFGMGTIGYAPPEQYRNLKPEINSRADLYSIGMVAYEALAGKHPFFSLNLDQLGLIRKMDTEDVPALIIPGDSNGILGEFLSALLQRFPSRRPQTATEAISWFGPIQQALSTN